MPSQEGGSDPVDAPVSKPAKSLGMSLQMRTNLTLHKNWASVHRATVAGLQVRHANKTLQCILLRRS